MSIADRLARVADHSTLRLTHYGRRSGKPYEVVVWFAVDGGVVYLSTLNRDRQWTRNVVARPDVVLAVGGERFAGRVTVLDQVADKRHVYERLAAKYWAVWLIDRVARLVGRDPRAGDFDTGRRGYFRVDLHE